MKAAGLCSVSGEPCFDVLDYWPSDHPVYAGLPRRLGAPHEDALRLTLILVNGSHMNLTIKEQYLAEFHVALPEVWRLVKNTTRTLRKAHKHLGQVDFTSQQCEVADQHNLAFNDNVPLGVLCWEKWKDIQHGA
ncbi:MAG: hypothetical protein AB7Q01_14115 [Gammaproteobacteria bacterium]